MRRLSILIFHRVLAQPDPLQPDIPDADCFRSLMAWVGRLYTVLPLAEAVERLQAGTLPSRAVAITFDDGYADNAELALPILEELGLSATFFIATGYLDGGCMWNDRIIEAVRRWRQPLLSCPEVGLTDLPAASQRERHSAVRALLPRIKYLQGEQREALALHFQDEAGADSPALMMSHEQVRLLYRSGMGIGGHTVSHPILANLPAERAKLEMLDGKRALEAIIEDDVTLFAYPNGKPVTDYDPDHARLAAEVGFEAAVSTQVGCATSGSDIYQLPRFTPWDRTPLRFSARLTWQRLRSG